ncbi:MAG: prolyl aminopeptidase [Alphaproteobacteria bacterium CG_4_9_14_3_um_filter_47_13]|nr:MAG: prolyl aminopeptidase [Alphaproteobacteria bacterium CG_4_9_14_3_um_filter_47_13]
MTSRNVSRRSTLLELFPPISPYSTGFIEVNDIHSLYWEQCGNPDGVPIVFLHGGPGAGTTPMHRSFFDPDHYRIVIFDQRGAGRSSPLGCLEDNTLENLVADIEALRNHLHIKRWHLFGGSWGSTLALAYSQTYPDRCISMILRGIFLLEQPEIDWFLYGMKMIFPEAWEQFSAIIPKESHKDLLQIYHQRLTSPDDKLRMGAAIGWSLYEGACSSLFPNYETITTEEQKSHALALARLESHYFLNEVIAPENSLLHGIDKIRHIPATIIQGRYDVICPIFTAHRLHAAWPEADYIVVPDGGHSALDPAIRSRLIEATENARTLGG